MVKALQCSVCFKAAKSIETAFAHVCTPQQQGGIGAMIGGGQNKAKQYFIIDVE